MKFQKRVSTLFLHLLLIFPLLLSACNTGNLSEREDVQGKKVIRIGYQKNGPLIIVKERGTLEKRLKPLGYTVQWSEFQAGPALLEALNAGSIDLGRTGDSPPIFAQAAGSSLVYLAAGNSKYKGSGILVKEDPSIKTVADLEGKTVGFAKGSSSHFLLVKALEKAGLEYSDIKPAYLAPGDARVAFEQGKIDAWVVWDPYTADTEISAQARLLTNGEGLTSDRDFFLASANFAENHRELLKVVLDEIRKSCEWANENHDEVSQMLAKILGFDEAAIRKALERREYGVVEIDDNIIKEQQDIADTFYRLKIIPKKINAAEKVFDLNKNTK